MSGLPHLVACHLRQHRRRTLLLVLTLGLALGLPLGLGQLVETATRGLRARAASAPLLIGARGSPTDLCLAALYYRGRTPTPITMAAYAGILAEGLGTAIPLHLGQQVQDAPLVGTDPAFFAWRRLAFASGGCFLRIGDCVLGATCARRQGLQVGDRVVAHTGSGLDVAAAEPLHLRVRGILAASGGPDDAAVFCDLRSCWAVAGLLHGHDAPAQGGRLPDHAGIPTLGASIIIDQELLDAERLHGHGDPGGRPLHAIVVLPHDARGAELLAARHMAAGQPRQVVRPPEVIADLLATIARVRGWIQLGLVAIASATIAIVILVLCLSAQARRDEFRLLDRLGAGRGQVRLLLLGEGAWVLGGALLLVAGLGLLAWMLGPALVPGLLG